MNKSFLLLLKLEPKKTNCPYCPSNGNLFILLFLMQIKISCIFVVQFLGEKMKVLVLNSGSSSIKFKIFDGHEEIFSGMADSISLDGSKLVYSKNGSTKELKTKMQDHREALNRIIALILDEGIISSLSEIDAVGHRVVHGGESFNSPVLIDDHVLSVIKSLYKIAPLHNPANVMGIEAISEILPSVKQVAVFDTGFHSTIPDYSFLYGLPITLYHKNKIRRYGFHGTSHEYVCTKAAEIIGRPLSELNLISCHLGNGSSITAVKAGKSVDTSMGFTPVEGLIMGTRCGDIDPSIVTYLQRSGMGTDEIDNLLNKKSGLLGISQISSDMRILHKESDNGNEKAKLAMKMFAYRIKKYIGSYLAVLGGVDAIIFTGGIGENAYYVREMALEDLSALNISLDLEKNKNNNLLISADNSVKVFVIPTNEELFIAEKTIRIVGK